MGDSVKGLLILTPITILIVVVFVSIKCAGCSAGRWQQLHTSIKRPFIKHHKRKNSNPSESKPSVDLERGPV